MALSTKDDLECSSNGAKKPFEIIELLPPEYSRAVSLIAFHAAVVPKSLGDKLLKLLQSKCPIGPELIHLKRVRTAPSSESVAPKGSLEVLLCPKDSQPPQEVSEFLSVGGCAAWHTVEVPEYGALTRSQLADFSRHWPLTYRKPAFEPLELSEDAKAVYVRLFRRAEQVGAGHCGCVIADCHGRELAAASDASSQHPLRHAVMAAIDAIATSHAAAKPGSKRPHISDDYLCCNCDVVITHEPCVMCAMALVHSRVRLVAYRHPDTEFGGFGGKLSLHTCSSLNHQVRVLHFRDL
jgi:tRNA-specific adenosine deaminase 3